MRPLFFPILVCLAMAFSSTGWCQLDASLLGKEPSPEELGAPLYPGAEFIRLSDNLDPYYQTAMYITLVPFDMAEDFFNRKMPEKRLIMYDDKLTTMNIYLLRTWSKFPPYPTREELKGLDSEPNLRIQYYNPDDYEMLTEIYERNPETENKATTIRKGQTMLLYTFEKKERITGNEKLIGRWQESSRDYSSYYGTQLVFNTDSTYVYTATPANLASLARDPKIIAAFPGKNEQEIAAIFTERNPEKGTFQVMNNTITMISEAPLDGIRNKSGLATIGPVTFSLELINKPRLVFLKQ